MRTGLFAYVVHDPIDNAEPEKLANGCQVLRKVHQRRARPSRGLGRRVISQAKEQREQGACIGLKLFQPVNGSTKALDNVYSHASDLRNDG